MLWRQKFEYDILKDLNLAHLSHYAAYAAKVEFIIKCKVYFP